MPGRGMQLFQFSNSNPAIREVSWERLPPGAIVIDWPKTDDLPVPELLSYPVMTESLRSDLTEKYRFLRGVSVTIADPSLGLEPPEVEHLVRKAGRMHDGLRRLNAYRSRIFTDWENDPDALAGLAEATRHDNGPHTRVKSWLRPVSMLVRSGLPFGVHAWGPGIAEMPLVTLISGLLSEEIRVPEPHDTLVDVGVDVSHSMRATGKAEYALDTVKALLLLLGARLAVSTWRAWLVGDRAAPVDWKRLSELSNDARGGESELDVLLRANGIGPGETNLAPFLREVVNSREMCRRHLCILITDGAYQDRASSLRLAERLRSWGTDYVQLLLHRDGEFDLTDSEIAELAERRLREATDIAEAAHGGQLVLNLMPLLGYVSIDVYERWLGEVVASL